MADLDNDGISGRSTFLVRETDRGKPGRRFFRGSLHRLGRGAYAQLGGFLALRLGHMTSFPEAPRSGVHLQAGPSGGGGKDYHPG
jgi:hypothetical protein